MSWRDSAGRGNGDNQPSFFPAGSVDVRIPAPVRLRNIWVQAGAQATTVEIKVNGVDPAGQSPAKTVSIPAGTGKMFTIASSANFLKQGDRFQVVTSQSDAVVSAAWMRA